MFNNSLIPSFLQRKRDRTPANSEAVPSVKAPTTGDQDNNSAGQVAANSTSGEVEEGDIFSQLDTFKKETGVRKEKLFNEVSREHSYEIPSSSEQH
jgi:hypothetical protein